MENNCTANHCSTALCDPPGVRDGRHSPDDPQEHGPQTVEDELRVGVTLVLQTELLPRTELGRARLSAAVVEKNAAMVKCCKI